MVKALTMVLAKLRTLGQLFVPIEPDESSTRTISAWLQSSGAASNGVSLAADKR